MVSPTKPLLKATQLVARFSQLRLAKIVLSIAKVNQSYTQFKFG